MSSRSRIGSRDAGTHGVDTATWAEVDADALPADRRAQFQQRRAAITMYLDGASDYELRQATSLARSNVYRLIVDRCLAPHAHGTNMG